jgi:hypothetical protein
MIYKIAERFGKRGASDEFVNNYVSMIKDNSLSIGSEAFFVRDFD